MTSKELIEFVQWTHLHSKLISIVREESSEYYGMFYILTKEGEAKYMTVKELYDFWKSNPEWVIEVYNKRIYEREK